MTPMKIAAAWLALILTAFAADSSTVTLPAAGERVFQANDLYGHINGGAELFLEFGFRELTVYDYADGERKISVEVYRMATADGALGVYLMKVGEETPHPAVPARNSWNRYQATALKGKRFIQVNNFGGDRLLEGDVVNKMRNVLLKTGDVPRPPLLNLLPLTGRVPRSERLICGLYSLQSLVTLGDGDILLLSGEVYGAAARYEDGREPAHTLIRIPYPDETAASRAFDNLTDHLDPFYSIIDRGEKSLLFRDKKGRYGLARRYGRRLDLKLNLETIDSERAR